jgi:hypothetical protein
MKEFRVSRGMAPHLLNFATRWRSVVNFMPWLIYILGKEPVWRRENSVLLNIRQMKRYFK